MVLVKAVTSFRMPSKQGSLALRVANRAMSLLGTAAARISMAALSFQNQSTASSVSSASFHSMLESIFCARDLSNLLQVLEKAKLKQRVLALKFSTLIEESVDRRQKRRPMLHRVERRSIMQWTEEKTNIAKGGRKGCKERGQSMIFERNK